MSSECVEIPRPFEGMPGDTKPNHGSIGKTVTYKKTIGDWAMPALWAMKYRRLDGKPMRFFDKKVHLFHRPWQVDIVNDMSPFIVVEKARQMGVTEVMQVKMIHMATLHRTRAIYTMPKWPKAREIASTRIHPLGVPGHPHAFTGDVLARMTPGWRSMMSKAIIPRVGGGTSDILITGSWNEDLGESTAADHIYLDEYDRMRPGVIAAFRECLSSSWLDYMRLFSTPTFPKAGVNGQYLSSDQRRWFWKCIRCGHKQPLTRANIFQKKGPSSLIDRLEAHDESAKVADGTFYLGCVKCHRKLNRMRAKGEWVVGAHDGESHGYKISQLDCPWHTPDAIMRKLRDMKPGLQPWMNYVIGEPYLGDTGQLPENFIYQLVDPELKIVSRQDFDQKFKGTAVVVGIDWGKTNWAMAVGLTPEYENPILLDVFMFRDTIRPADTVKAMLDFSNKWRANVVSADYGYGQDRNPEMYKHYPRVFWVVRYPPAGSAGATSEPLYGPNPCSSNSPYSTVLIGRAPSLKEHILGLHAKNLSINNIPTLEPVMEVLDLHFRNVAIAVEELADGSQVEVAQTTGPDHYLHTYNYCMIGKRWLDVTTIKASELDAPRFNQPPEYTGGVSVPTFEEIVDGLDIFDL